MSLNILLVRLLFCACARMTGIFQKRQAAEACRLRSRTCVGMSVGERCAGRQKFYFSLSPE